MQIPLCCANFWARILKSALWINVWKWRQGHQLFLDTKRCENIFGHTTERNCKNVKCVYRGSVFPVLSSGRSRRSKLWCSPNVSPAQRTMRRCSVPEPQSLTLGFLLYLQGVDVPVDARGHRARAARPHPPGPREAEIHLISTYGSTAIFTCLQTLLRYSALVTKSFPLPVFLLSVIRHLTSWRSQHFQTLCLCRACVMKHSTCCSVSGKGTVREGRVLPAVFTRVQVTKDAANFGLTFW